MRSISLYLVKPLRLGLSLNAVFTLRTLEWSQIENGKRRSRQEQGYHKGGIFSLFWKGVTHSVIFRDSISQGINFIFLGPTFKTIKFVPISIFQAQYPLHHLLEQEWSFSFSSILCTHSHPDLKFVWVSSPFHLSQAYLLLWVALLKSLPLTLGGLQGPLLLWFPSSLRSVCWQCLYIFMYVNLILPANLRNPSRQGLGSMVV